MALLKKYNIRSAKSRQVRNLHNNYVKQRFRWTNRKI